MKNFNRFTEPENMIEQSGRLIKLKITLVVLIILLGIIMLIFLASCSKPTQTIIYHHYISEQTNIKDTTGDTKKLEALIKISKYWNK